MPPTSSLSANSCTKGFFITGTDTGVGKTRVTGLLAAFWLNQGRQVQTQKWVQTGVTRAADGDIFTHDQCIQQLYPAYQPDQRLAKLRTVYTFPLPASPQVAAAQARRRISAAHLQKSFGELSAVSDLVLVEGAGGLLVPYATGKYLLDVAQALALPVIVVVANKLGAVNHTLLTLEALQRRQLPVAAVIFNQITPEVPAYILRSNVAAIQAEVTSAAAIPILSLPYQAQLTDLSSQVLAGLVQNMLDLEPQKDGRL